MSRFVEITSFTAIAVAVHVGLFVQLGPSGAQSQGATGQASISLAAASPDMVDRVAAWTRPVDMMQEVPAMPSRIPQQSTSMPAVSPPLDRTMPTVVPALPQPAPAVPDALPRVDTQTAAPPRPQHAPEVSPRPQPRVAQKPKTAAKPKPKTAAKPKPKRAGATPAKSQKAKGGATGRNAGVKKKQKNASLSKAARQSLMARWGASIRNRVERRKRYPSGTTASGTTVLRITISRSGRIQGVSVVKSSGARRLDQAAIRAVKRARYSAAPKGLTAAQYKFNLPVAFRRK